MAATDVILIASELDRPELTSRVVAALGARAERADRGPDNLVISPDLIVYLDGPEAWGDLPQFNWALPVVGGHSAGDDERHEMARRLYARLNERTDLHTALVFDDGAQIVAVRDTAAA